LIIRFSIVNARILSQQALTTPRWSPNVDAEQGGAVGIFDKAIDKVEEFVGDAREKTGLAPDDESQISRDTDPSRSNIAPTDDSLKDS
jgi:hypothetical protein